MHFYTFVLISFYYLIFIMLGKIQILHNFLPEIVEQIPVFMGGASAIYFICIARSPFSKLATLYSVLLSSCSLFFVGNHVPADIAILLVICISFSFLFAFYFVSEKVSMDKHFEPCFVLLITSRFFMSPIQCQWEMALVLELILLFGFNYGEAQEDYQPRKGVFFSLTLFFLLSIIYIYSTGQDILIYIVLAAAGAGCVQFMCLSKTQRGHTLAVLVYIILNVVLGFILRDEGETFPNITICFLIVILLLFISLWLISKIKNDSISAVLSESKTTLRVIFFPALYLLNDFFYHGYLKHWIASLIIQISVLQLLKFILKKEDEAPDREGDQGEGNKGEKKNDCSKREENSRKE